MILSPNLQSLSWQTTGPASCAKWGLPCRRSSGTVTAITSLPVSPPSDGGGGTGKEIYHHGPPSRQLRVTSATIDSPLRSDPGDPTSPAALFSQLWGGCPDTTFATTMFGSVPHRRLPVIGILRRVLKKKWEGNKKLASFRFVAPIDAFHHLRSCALARSRHGRWMTSWKPYVGAGGRWLVSINLSLGP